VTTQEDHDARAKHQENRGSGGKMRQNTLLVGSQSRSLIASLFVSLLVLTSTFHSDATASTSATKKWTIMVFLNADNNLESYGYEDLKEMAKIGSTDEVDVVVQFDWIKTKGTKRIYIEKGNEKVVEEMEEQDMGDEKVFTDFVDWGMKNYPAEKYVVVMWNHGAGWSKSAKANVVKSISYDDTSGNHMSTNELQIGLEALVATSGKKIDVLSFDACLMAMAEVADSLTGVADYMVASEEVIPGDGYAYDDWFKAFMTASNGKELDFSTEKLLKDMVESYGKSYSGGSQGTRSITLSAFDLSKMESLKASINAWVSGVNKSTVLTKEMLKEAAKSAQAYYDSDYRDLASYMKNIKDKVMSMDPSWIVEDESLVTLTDNVLNAADDVVMENYASSSLKKSEGLAIHLPAGYYGSSNWTKSSKRRDAYMNISWGKTSTWVEHLDYVFFAN